MSKRTIIIILVLMLSIGIISLYSTFAIDEEATSMGESNADYNLIYAMQDKSNKQIILNENESKFVDITLNNTYSSTVKYGVYYYILTPKNITNGITATVDKDSKDLPEDTIKPGKSKSISIKITNNTDNQVSLIVGALVGFENGKIEDLVKNNEVLIKD